MRFAGKKFVLTGTFSYDLNRKAIEKLIQEERGVVLKNVTAEVDYLVVGETRGSGPSGAEKKAAQLNQKGASIQLTDVDQLAAMLWPARDEALAMLVAGRPGITRFNWLTGGFCHGGLSSAGTIDLSGAKLSKLDLCEANLDCGSISTAPTCASQSFPTSAMLAGRSLTRHGCGICLRSSIAASSR